MPAIDELQMLAHARAAMMRRGFEDLVVECGPDFNRALGDAISDDGICLDMRVIVSRTMEGFRVVHAPKLD